MATLKAKQDDLRRLMKERRENLKNKVDSPFANLGQLSCIICNVQVKSNGLWVSHVAGKVHKENALKKKKGTTDEFLKGTVLQDKEKYKMHLPAAKKKKITTSEHLAKAELDKNSEKISLLEAYSTSSSEGESDTDEQPQSSTSKIISSNTLPKDFYDQAISTNIEPPHKEEKIPPVIYTNAAEALPEGFFDDPVLDAKARNLEYKDPIEDEWEKYQKAIAEETNVSKTIMEEDLEESILERDIVQIDEQIHQWEKIKNLQSLAENVKAKASSKNDEGNSSSNTDDELEEDDLLDWRSKSVANR